MTPLNIFKPFLTGTSPKFKQGLACGARAQDQGHRWHERPSALADASSGSAMVKGLVCPEGGRANVSGRCWAGSIARLCAGCGVSEPVSAVDTMERAGTVRLPNMAVTRRIKNHTFTFFVRNVYQEYSRCARPLHHAYTHTLLSIATLLCFLRGHAAHVPFTCSVPMTHDLPRCFAGPWRVYLQAPAGGFLVPWSRIFVGYCSHTQHGSGLEHGCCQPEPQTRGVCRRPRAAKRKQRHDVAGPG